MAIGTKCALTYARIFLGKVETKFLETQRDTPFWWVRYIDNISFIWMHGQEKLQEFFRDINKFHTNLKFSSNSNKEDVAFLDIKVKVKQGEIETDLHVKFTDRHQYLHYTSSQLEQTKPSIVFSQSLRVSGICSKAEELRKHTTEMRPWFYKRGYSKGLVEKEMGKVKFSGFTRRNKRKKKGVPSVITYYPSLKKIGRIIKQNLYESRCSKCFTPISMISFCSARKLSIYLVKAKLDPLERTVDSVQCKGKWCQTCHNVKDRNIYQYNHE